MAFLYENQNANLGGIEGTGYAFTRRTYRGDEYQGVFFCDEGDQQALEALIGEEQVRFEGVLYRKSLSGKVSGREKTFIVDAHNLVSVNLGDRVDFKVIEEV